MPELYTPFFEKSMQNLGGAYLQKSNQDYMRDLAKNAWMGDQQAMSELATVNPQAAQMITASQRNVQQDELSAESTKRQLFLENREIIDVDMKAAAKMPYGQAKDYLAQRGQELEAEGIFPPGTFEPLTEESHEQIKAKFGEEVGALAEAQIKKIESDIAGVDPALSEMDKAKILKINAEIEKIGAETVAIRKKPTEKKKLTDSEAKAAGFYNRMINGESEIARIETENPDFVSSGFWERVGGITNVTSSKEYQQYKQAADDWIRAKLRRESGAVIGDDEMDKEYEIYFPQFGDSDAVLEQKKRARTAAIDAMKMGAGSADLATLGTVSTDDKQAKAWAKANPDDPRSAQILTMVK